MMSCADFRTLHNTLALETMQARRDKLEPVCAALWTKVRRLKRWRDKFAALTPAGLQYGQTKEQFDKRMRIINLREKTQARLDEAYREWAQVDVDLCNISRAIPVVRARLDGREQAPAVTVLDDFMGVFGYKKASGE